MRYGEDADPPRRVRRIEDLHAQEVILRGAIIEEFRGIFNLASLFADALAAVVPDHPYVAVARFEGLLGRFELKEKNEISIEVEPSSVSPVHESGVLEVPVGPVGGVEDSGAGAILDGDPLSPRDSVAQGGGSAPPTEERDGGSGDSDSGGEQISFGWGSGEELASGSVSGVGEGSE